jgi:hypothetical protein
MARYALLVTTPIGASYGHCTARVVGLNGDGIPFNLVSAADNPPREWYSNLVVACQWNIGSAAAPYAFRTEYDNAYGIGRAKLGRMAATLRRIERALSGTPATTFGEYVTRAAAALKIDAVLAYAEPDPCRRSARYAENEYREAPEGVGGAAAFVDALIAEARR